MFCDEDDCKVSRIQWTLFLKAGSAWTRKGGQICPEFVNIFFAASSFPAFFLQVFICHSCFLETHRDHAVEDADDVTARDLAREKLRESARHVDRVLEFLGEVQHPGDMDTVREAADLALQKLHSQVSLTLGGGAVVRSVLPVGPRGQEPQSRLRLYPPRRNI